MSLPHFEGYQFLLVSYLTLVYYHIQVETSLLVSKSYLCLSVANEPDPVYRVSGLLTGIMSQLRVRPLPVSMRLP